MNKGELMGIRFKELRELNNFTQGQLADFLEVDQSYISKFEKGERKISADILEKACELLGCNLSYFMNEEEYKPLLKAYRSNNFTGEDLETIAAIHKIALNLRFINSILEEENEK